MYEREGEEEQILHSQLMMPWSFMEFCSLGHWVPDALDLQKSVHDNQRPFFFYVLFKKMQNNKYIQLLLSLNL